MNNSVFSFEKPANEPVNLYTSDTAKGLELKKELQRQSEQVLDIPLIIGGKEIRTGKTGDVVMPHDHGHELAQYHKAGPAEVEQAIEAALKARQQWMELSWIERGAITMKAAELISRKYRYTILAATMLGQGKNAYQAEIDAACETVDFLRFNAYYARRIYSEQPASSSEQMNRVEYRPLEGFVFAITPFNFTAIASNLNMSMALMGNTVVWKPATTALLSNYYLMKIFQEAGVPDGVINFVPGSGSEIAGIVTAHPMMSGIHFTGSNSTFNSLWRSATKNLENYVSYPRIVGETGGKDFIFAHSSADPEELAVALFRGAFEYQGQKCSACSRAYIPESLWPDIRNKLENMAADALQGTPMDFNNFINAVIDEKSFDNIMEYLDYAQKCPEIEIVCGGSGDKSKGYFVEPTILLTTDPHCRTMEEEIFGPVLTVYVYRDNEYEETLKLCDTTSPYALTGSIFARDRYAAVTACRALRYAAGNFYYNDKCTGAVVGMQPFGGSRASGTNDKAGGPHNLLRWVSPRTIKETYLPARDYRYQ